MTLHRLLLGTFIALAATDAAAESILQKLNRGLQNVNQTLAGAQPASRTPSSTAPNALAALPQPTDQQIKQLTVAMLTPAKPPAVMPMYEEAKQVVGEVLLLSSCYPDYGISRYLMRYAAPNAFSHSFSAPMAGMTYHPKSSA